MPVLYGGGYYAGGSAGGSGGIAGPSGAQGASGIQGPQGISGVTGIQGPAGSQGTTGLQGPTGLQGGTGLQGPTGLAGVTGIQGPTGLQGGTGLQGPTGLQGVTGIQGPTGFLGPTGLQGPSGARGATGIAGAGGSGTSTLATMTDVVATGLSSLGQSLYYDSGTNKYQFRYGNYPIWDFRDLGGVGDNSTDNYQAFIKLGKALNASGGTAYFPASTGSYNAYLNGDPGTGGLGAVYNGSFYGLMTIQRNNITFYCDPGAEVKMITNYRLTGSNAVGSGNWFTFFINQDNAVTGWNFINGKYTFEYANTGLFTTVTDTFNQFDFWAGAGIYKLNMINVNFSGWCLGVWGHPLDRGFFRRQRINDNFFYNCTFTDWGPGEPDDLLTCQGRTIFDSCHFEATQAYMNSGRLNSHAMYIGGERPYSRVKNNTFKNCGRNGKYCINFYSTNVGEDYTHGAIVSNNVFINCGNPMETLDSSEFAVYKKNTLYPTTTGSHSAGVAPRFDRGRGFTTIDNMIDSIYCFAETHDVMIYRSMLQATLTSNIINDTPNANDSTFSTLISNNVLDKLGFGGNEPYSSLSLDANNVQRATADVSLNVRGYSSFYSFIVNTINVHNTAAVASSFTANIEGTGSAMHNMLATWMINNSDSTSVGRLVTQTSSVKRPFIIFNGLQLLSVFASGSNINSSVTSNFYSTTHYSRAPKKNVISFMLEGDTFYSGGYSHGFIGCVQGANIRHAVSGNLLDDPRLFNTYSGAVYQ